MCFFLHKPGEASVTVNRQSKAQWVKTPQKQSRSTYECTEIRLRDNRRYNDSCSFPEHCRRSHSDDTGSNPRIRLHLEIKENTA